MIIKLVHPDLEMSRWRNKHMIIKYMHLLIYLFYYIIIINSTYAQYIYISLDLTNGMI